jgi:ATP-binding cassette subfamily B protein
MRFHRLYARVLARLRPERRLALILALGNIALAVAQFAEPLLLGRIVDRLSSAQVLSATPRWGDLAPWLAAWAGFGLFTILAGVLVALNADRLAHRRRVAAMAEYFDHVLHLPMSFHGGAHTGRLLKVMIEGSNGMFGVWLSFFREHCAGFVALLILLPMTLVVNWRLGAILLALVAIFAFLMNLVSKRTESMQSEADTFGADLAERVSDVLGNIPVIQSFARADEETRALGSLIQRMLDAQMPVLAWWALATVATRASSTLALLAILVAGVWLDIQGLTTIGEIVAFMSLASTLIGRLEQIVGFVNFMVSQGPKLQQFFDVMDTRPSVADNPGARDAGRLAGHVRFEGVSFSYDGRRQALDGVDFDAPAGKVIALVGATGSGKTTTLNLLHRVFDPTEGRILVDGRDIRDLTLVSLRANIGVVFQEPFIFARSIAENLRIGKPDATRFEMERALDQAQALDFVLKQPMGIETIIGERGRNLSGGERQRLSIARALLKDPPIMILDEATSALDANTERQVQQALYAATRGRTTLVIAHRLATIRNADLILVFEHGRVVESGGFEALVERQGLFASLAKAQFIAAEPQPV